jgi:phage/plasmid primase-like uncharacterized protein
MSEGGIAMLNEQIHLKSAADQFRDAMTEKGLTPPDSIIGDGKLHRFSSNGRPDDEAGWYVLYDGNIAAGAFGDWRTNQAVKSWIADIGRTLTPDEKRDFQKKQEELRILRDKETAQRRAAAKTKASGMLKSATDAPNDHPYLVRKKVQSHGLRTWKDMLLIPMQDETGEVQSLQMISADGSKKFLTGGKMKGCYFPIGDFDKADEILIAEGYATAATLFEVTGLPVIVAYNAGNLLSVARTIRAQYPSASLILCADDDIKTKGNPGMTKATEAAEAVGGAVMVPNFRDNRPDGATDFNDMAEHVGKDAVSDFFKRHLTEVDNTLAASVPDEPADERAAYFCKSANTNKPPFVDQRPITPPNVPTPHVPPFVLPLRDPVAPPKTHFAASELALVNKIWKVVSRQAVRHTDSAYTILLDEKHMIIVTRDRIELELKPKYRPDTAYAAACEHARQFWGGQMEVHGDSQHSIMAWAYADVHGIQITNFTPTDKELIHAEKIMANLRKQMEPSFSRPSTIKSPASTGKPSP